MTIRIEQVEPRTAAAIDFDAPVEQIGDAMGGVFGELYATIGAQQVAPTGPPFSMYPEAEPRADGSWHVVTGVPIDGQVDDAGRVHAVELPGGDVAVATHVGPYETLEQTYRMLMSEIQDAGLEPQGPMWESYLTDPGSEPDPAKWRTEVRVPVGRRASS